MLRCPNCEKTFLCEIPKATVVGESPAAPESIILEDELPQPVPQADQAPPPLPERNDSPAASLEEALAEMGGDAEPRPKPRENPRQWCVVVDGVAAVALTYRELVARAREGKIKRKTKIYFAPKEVTIPARDIPGLFPEEDARRAEQAARKRPASGSSAASAAAAAAALDQMAEAEAEEESEDASDVPPPPSTDP
jgi:hypothetical protein